MFDAVKHSTTLLKYIWDVVVSPVRPSVNYLYAKGSSRDPPGESINICPCEPPGQPELLLNLFAPS
jgi:hypothetical protein